MDSGKTTLAESILFQTGKIRKLGRVDHGDAYLDNYELEQSRGITIFSKQAEIMLGDRPVTLLDTPGHVDFAAEMERTLQVLDYAILVVNGADGVQGHTETLWRLLARYRIPTFIFVNKMDQAGTDPEKVLTELQDRLSEGCTAFPGSAGLTEGNARVAVSESEWLESMAMLEETAMEEYLETDMLSADTIRRLIRSRRLFPCYFGSALKQEGIEAFLQGLEAYMESPVYPNVFGARVYKISRDPAGNRLTHMKITGGSLKVKEALSAEETNEEQKKEKVNQIRIYSGEKYELVQEAEAGTVCAVTGLTFTRPGMTLGEEKDVSAPMLEPVLSYRVQYPREVDAHTMLGYLKQLEEEDPMLRIVWKEENGEIGVQLMGEIQIEILRSLIEERFGIVVTFDAGSIVYKETIRNTVEGVGHYEPLRHYSEVHLIMEPGEPGSGVVCDTECSEDVLDKNWQRLILTHLYEKQHRGVLTGSAITDVHITLAAGRAHLKHTEGGDFRQAVYRAVRQGLMQADNVLLEPYYSFVMEIPAENVGRALNDIQKMHGEFEPPETDGDMTVITGMAPVSAMRDYQMEVTTYTRGRGRLFCTLDGYRPCADQDTVIEEIGYDPEADTENPAGSVFCSHGAGYYVPWNEVFSHMHIESQLKKRQEIQKDMTTDTSSARRKDRMTGKKAPSSAGIGWNAKEEKELEDIFIRTYGKIERRNAPVGQMVVTVDSKPKKHRDDGIEYLLVDGYNVIFAWDELKELAKDNIEAARNKLMDVLSNYQGFRRCVLILVFDAYKVDGEALEIQRYHNIHVVFTKEAETADQYIEKVVHEIGRKRHVTVVTSDGVEQVITTSQGAHLISAREFREEIAFTERLIREEWDRHRESDRNYLFDHMDKELVRHMEEVRLGRKNLK